MATGRVVPDAELSDVNLVASIIIDHDGDPDSDSSVTAATGNNVSTEYGVDFPTPDGNPTVGAGLQEFRAGVLEFDSGQTGTPQARIELWENGSLVRAGTDTNVTVYQILSLPWNANELATPDGSLVQMKVIGTATGGSPTVRNTINIGQFEWNADWVSGTVVTPPNATLTITTFAPVIKLPVTAKPGKATLTITTFAPSIIIGSGSDVVYRSMSKVSVGIHV